MLRKSNTIDKINIAKPRLIKKILECLIKIGVSEFQGLRITTVHLNKIQG